MENRHKKLTRFLCQELLYEYVSGTLDQIRRRDVEEYLPTCRDSQRELENLKKGLAYAREVGSIQVSTSLRSALMGFEPAWKKRLRAWTLWSSQRGWRMLPYGFLFCATLLGLFVTKPWKKEGQRDVVIVEQARTEPVAPETPASSPQIAQAVSQAAQPQTPSPLAPNAVMAPAPVSALPASAPLAQVSPAAEPTTAGRASPASEADERTAAAETNPNADEAHDNDPKREPGSGKGSLLRGNIVVEDFASAWPAVRDKIESLGGKAAGNVELGWLRHPNESYFHFSLPESNYGELETFLKTFGPVRISKERHPRVMPEGQIRIILTVKDGGQHEGEAEAP